MSCGIYKYENLITHQIYIGQAIDLQERYKKHKQNMSDLNHMEDFYIGLREYGLENFSYEILEEFEAFDQNLLNELECYYIEKYNSMKPNGYNMIPGGSNGAGLAKSKIVYQFDLLGNFIQEFYSAHEASRKTGIDYSSICSCCRKEKTNTKNYQWSYDRNDVSIRDIHLQVTYRDRRVLQYDKNGNIIQIYTTLTEAAAASGVAKSTISNVCRGIGKSGGGFIWRYEDIIDPKIDKIQKANKKVVLQFDKSGNYIAEFESASAASQQTGINLGNISQVCMNKRKTAGGYIWKYKEKNEEK